MPIESETRRARRFRAQRPHPAHRQSRRLRASARTGLQPGYARTISITDVSRDLFGARPQAPSPLLPGASQAPRGTIVAMTVDTGSRRLLADRVELFAVANAKRRFGELADLADRLIGAGWRLGIGGTTGDSAASRSPAHRAATTAGMATGFRRSFRGSARTRQPCRCRVGATSAHAP